MGHPRRYYPSKHTYFVTNRLAEGLPFVANEYINQMILGIIARANFNHPEITLVGFEFLANHYHMILVLDGDPNQLSGFMNYFDGEIAKLVVRWLGKRNVKVWAQRYCASVILTSDKVLEKLVYLFANPLQAHLVASVKDWKGCSSFYSLHDEKPRVYKWIKPSLAPLLPNGRFKRRLVKALLKNIEEQEAPSYSLRLDPFAWMDCFAETKRRTKSELKAELFLKLAKIEKRCAHERQKLKKAVPSVDRLAEENPHRYYKPKKFGRRVFCISSCPELRQMYIEMYKDLCNKADQAWLKFRANLSELIVPHGMFLPPSPARGSIIGRFG